MKRNHELRVKLDKEELEKIKRKAEQLGLSTSSFLRLLALNSTISVLNVD